MATVAVLAAKRRPGQKAESSARNSAKIFAECWANPLSAKPCDPALAPIIVYKASIGALFL